MGVWLQNREAPKAAEALCTLAEAKGCAWGVSGVLLMMWVFEQREVWGGRVSRGVSVWVFKQKEAEGRVGRVSRVLLVWIFKQRQAKECALLVRW